MSMSNTWKHYYQSLPSNEDANKNLSSFSTDSVFSPGSDFGANIKKNLVKDIDSIILAKAPGSSTLTMFHSLKNLGGTRSRPADKHVGLLGFGPDATAVIFDATSIATIVEESCPTITVLKNISDHANVSTATIPPTRPYELKSGVLQFLPPFISNPFIELTDKDPAHLLVDLNAIVTSFDSEHAGDTSFASACDNCKQLRAFLYCCATDKVNDLTCRPDPDDAELQLYKSKRHQDCILPVQDTTTSKDDTVGNTDAVQQLAVNLQNQTDLIEELKIGREEARSEKKVKFDDLHGSSSRLILNASSQNGEVTPGKPSSHCAEFFAKTSASKAGNFLVTTLKDEYSCHPDLQQGLIQALYDGHFLRDREDTPGNFSFFLCPRMQPLATGNRKRDTILQIKTKQGKGWNDEDYESAVKQGISTPQDINTMMHQLKILWGLSSLFFGDKSLLPRALSNFIVAINENCITFEANQLSDEQFFTKLGYQIDTRIFRWLQQCGRNEVREKVDDDIINFSPLITQVLNAQFFQVLPPTFKMKDKENDDNDGNDGHKKKKKKQNQEESRLVQNSSKIEAWMSASRDDYQRYFAGKHLQLRPQLNGRPMCQRFHSKGHCFSDCINAASHIPSTNIPSDTSAKYAAYCQKCKEDF